MSEDGIDDWGGWDRKDWSGYWVKYFRIQQAAGDPAAQNKLITKFGLRDQEHFDAVRQTFERHFGEDPEFMKVAGQAAMEANRLQMQADAPAGVLDPVEGVSLETYATIAARLANVGSGGAAAVGKVLADFKLDVSRYNAVDAGWQQRMQGPGGAAVMAEYGKYFAAAGQGQYGAAAQAASASLGVSGNTAAAPAGGEPLSFERWAEISAAQSCWAESGQDVSAKLKQVFGMSPLDWSNVSAYWSQRMMADWTIAQNLEQFTKKYRAKYAEANPDDDLSV